MSFLVFLRNSMLGREDRHSMLPNGGISSDLDANDVQCMQHASGLDIKSEIIQGLKFCPNATPLCFVFRSPSPLHMWQ